MKKFGILSALLFLAAFILLPATCNGKYNVSKSAVADGYAPPRPIAPSSIAIATTDTLIADGNPYPPLPPKPPNLGVLVADGNPYPPLPPNPSAMFD